MRRKAGFECHFCSKVSQSKEENLAHEEEEHAEIASYKCRQCSERFSSKAHARLHFVNAHTNEVKNFACDTCSKTFKNRYQLVLHTRSHTGEKPFTCSVCKRGFSMSSNLQKHMVSSWANSLCELIGIVTLFYRQTIAGYAQHREELCLHRVQTVLQDPAIAQVPHHLLPSARGQGEVPTMR